ncbi:fimbrial chaperone protein [Luteibacter sp. Sphag1AF]|uniref:fimbria/pilus periplasmic chaperone n=1 Tax=Luteibacter sp. Sphag1AF TaxID=2587031 RepID=UPI0016146441|nr:fimbrial chaperone protein [Luteibacter sp. Sphag1AF]
MLLAVWALCVHGTAMASGLQVSPIGLQLAPDAQADALWLTNTGSDIIHAQVRVFRWTQVDGKDVLEPSRDIIVSPPMITVAPGERQLVRVIRGADAPADTEASYRVLVDELPVDQDSKPGLRFVLRYSIPVFLSPTDGRAVVANLRAQWVDSPEGPAVRVINTGNGHAQLADLAIAGPNNRHTTVLPGLVGYTLPGSTMTWRLPEGTRRAGATLRVRINGDASESTLAMDADGR